MTTPRIRRAGLDDLAALVDLEALSFPPERRESRASWRNSLLSPHQSVWIARAGEVAAAAMTLRLHPAAVRIFSLAVHPGHRGAGLGSVLMRRAFAEARGRKALRLTLEVDADDRRLVDWYAACGFALAGRLPDYYGPGLDAVRMMCCLPAPAMMKNAPP